MNKNNLHGYQFLTNRNGYSTILEKDIVWM